MTRPTLEAASPLPLWTRTGHLVALGATLAAGQSPIRGVRLGILSGDKP